MAFLERFIYCCKFDRFRPTIDILHKYRASVSAMVNFRTKIVSQKPYTIKFHKWGLRIDLALLYNMPPCPLEAWV
jgi:hypothetical protein